MTGQDRAGVPPSCIPAEAILGLTRIRSLWRRTPWKIAQLYSRNQGQDAPGNSSSVNLPVCANLPCSCQVRCQDVGFAFKRPLPKHPEPQVGPEYLRIRPASYSKDFQLDTN